MDDDSPAIPCWNPGSDDVLPVPLGRIDARAGRAAYDYLVGATRAALAGRVDAIVTAPLNKAALHAAGLNFPGHTEILASECNVAEVAMMLYLPPGGLLQNPAGLGVAHATLHTSIRSVPDLLTKDRVRETIALLHRFLKSIGVEMPRIGVCALNPHAGEQGLFGDEESRIIAPAVQAAQAANVEAQGPIPADALMRRAAAGEFDGVVAMYHDQGHIALKLLGFDRAVNITLGLPIVRTSPSHGTAFDIAGKGIANADGFREAIRMAVRLCAAKG
jgi:4-hydroxythreonine-4-phosphate dehydrogenase